MEQLNANGADIYICAHGESLELLKIECNYAHFVEDIPFEVTYGNTSTKSIFKLISQLPKMWFQVYKEHQHLKKLVKQYQIELVISDNRFGFYHAHVPSIFITHQINIKVPFGGALINFINHYFIKKYTVCWVPDLEQNVESLAGDLSRNKHLKNVKYIGPLSRGKRAKELNELKPIVMYLLSGVEPQRSILEQHILQYHEMHPHQAILVRGTNKGLNKILPKQNLTVFEMCNAEQLQNLVSACKYVVCRSGYSSVMDLVKWQKNAVLIPTPGQFEQEYLAKYLSQKKWFYFIEQKNFLNFDATNMIGYECPKFDLLESNVVEMIKEIL